MTKRIAFIPARQGSKRVPNKNIKLLNGHPLISYSIISAIKSEIFDDIVCITDSYEYAEIAIQYGATVPIMRPNEISQDHSTDFDWLNWIFDYYARVDVQYDNFAILRPTSPFRTSETIKRAYLEFYSNPHCDSLRAVEKCKQHPGKMWKIYNDFMVPILPYTNETTPWHSCPYSTLPEIYVQNACIEISKVSSFIENKSISGNKIFPFITHNFEGMDINYEDDWDYIEHLIFKNPSLLEYIN